MIEVPRFFLQNVLEQMLDHFLGECFTAQRRERRDAHERAFKATDIATDAVGEEFEDFVRQLDLHPSRFLAQNRQPRFDGRWLKLGGQSPFEPRDQAVLEVRDFRRRAIARQHDLFVPVKESVEGVKKLLLRAFFAAKELNVVNAKQIGLTIALAKLDQIIVLNGVDELVDEQFARKIDHFGVFLFREHVLTDRLHQVRLAEANAAVNKKRIVGAGWCLSDGETGRVRNFIVRPDYEGFESVARI